ncbi:sulfite exporter TauE/SafE family protein [Stenomitos frigidus]|uniref:Ferric reductase n=1 Tax=Stenomitos frigidus ULC18 TaxID=2107698 RepID=A0A2T1E3R4_9CYAN|nr:sulfite exporter TauE/SafE family protein [Stenomitos frigidus]PSB27365.1 ferric reductase [Stenomitos frigidus ULC18]
MADLLLVMLLGLLGSFGHCVGMCGPLTAAFALSQQASQPSWQQRLAFHGLLNLGRIVSYALVGAGIGALGSVLVAGGQLAGIGSGLRQGLSIATGLLLIWMGLTQINPKLLPGIPLLHPILQGGFHEGLSAGMMKLSNDARWWTPALLGMTWGLIPCGFLYTAQVKAAETGNLWHGTATMLAFGLGTVPSMLGIGLSTSLLSRDRRSQLFRMGGWVTLTIGILTLLRTDAMVDYTGHAAILCLMLALLARPISRLWPFPLRYRRVLGVGAYILSLAHTGHMLDHTFEWDLQGLPFLPIEQQVGLWAGIIAIGLMTPVALTSFDWMVKTLGQYWRYIHLLSVPALILCVAHTVIIGSHYLGATQWTTANKVLSGCVVAATVGVLCMRPSWLWSIPFLKPFHVSPIRTKD